MAQPYSVTLDPDTARQLATNGATVLLLDVPAGTVVGVDQQVCQGAREHAGTALEDWSSSQNHALTLAGLCSGPNVQGHQNAAARRTHGIMPGIDGGAVCPGGQLLCGPEQQAGAGASLGCC